MSDLHNFVSTFLEVPKSVILQIKEYPERKEITVILSDMSKRIVPMQKEETAVNTDKLTAILGIGRTTASRLNEAGIYTYEQLASHDLQELAAIGKVSPDVAKRWQEDVS